MQKTRRQLLGSIALGGAALGVSGCGILGTTTDPTTGAVSVGLDPGVETFIQNAVATIAKYEPDVVSIIDTAAALFGPAYAAVVTAGSAAVSTVITYLEQAVGQVPVVSARMRARLADAAPGVVPIATVKINGITVNITGRRVS